MKIFKRKQHKRSAWFEGLLYAEEMVKNGYTYNNVLDEPIWFTKIHECGSREQHTVSYSLDGRKDGVIDYLEYKRDVLDNLPCSTN